MESWAIRIPSSNVSPWLISVATSSVGLIAPPLISEKWRRRLRKASSASDLGVLDRPDGHDGVVAEVRPDEERLVVGVADDADPEPRAEPGDVVIELRPELGVLDVVDDPGECRRGRATARPPLFVPRWEW